MLDKSTRLEDATTRSELRTATSPSYVPIYTSTHVTGMRGPGYLGMKPGMVSRVSGCPLALKVYVGK